MRFDYLGNQPKQKTYVSMRPDTHNAYRRRLHAHRTVATMGCILSMWICAHCLSRSQVQSLCSPKLLLVSKYLWDTSWIWQFWLSWPHWWNPPPVSQTKPNPKHSSVLLYLSGFTSLWFSTCSPVSPLHFIQAIITGIDLWLPHLVFQPSQEEGRTWSRSGP